MFNKICCGLLLLVAAGTANAIPVSVSDQQAITTSNQLFNFNFNSLLASDGTGGQFSITLKGDYSPRNPPPLSEGATISLDIAGGTVELYNNSSTAAIFSNTIAGLSLNSTSFSGGGNDVTLGYVFDMNSALLDSILADNIISLSVQNTSDVNSGDFVRVGFDYNSGNATIPEPSTTALMALALLGLGFRKRA